MVIDTAINSGEKKHKTKVNIYTFIKKLSSIVEFFFNNVENQDMLYGNKNYDEILFDGFLVIAL